MSLEPSAIHCVKKPNSLQHEHGTEEDSTQNHLVWAEEEKKQKNRENPGKTKETLEKPKGQKRTQHSEVLHHEGHESMPFSLVAR